MKYSWLAFSDYILCLASRYDKIYIGSNGFRFNINNCILIQTKFIGMGNYRMLDYYMNLTRLVGHIPLIVNAVGIIIVDEKNSLIYFFETSNGD